MELCDELMAANNNCCSRFKAHSPKLLKQIVHGSSSDLLLLYQAFPFLNETVAMVFDKAFHRAYSSGTVAESHGILF